MKKRISHIPSMLACSIYSSAFVVSLWFFLGSPAYGVEPEEIRPGQHEGGTQNPSQTLEDEGPTAGSTAGRMQDRIATPQEPLVQESVTGSQEEKVGLVNGRAPESVPSLINALRDKNPTSRQSAAENLGRIGDKQASGALIRVLENDKDPHVLEAASEALSAIGDRQAVEPLILLLRNTNSDVRRLAAQVLGTLGDKQAVDPLIRRLGDEDSGVRGAAARALEKLGEPLGPLIHEILTGSKEAKEELKRKKDPRALQPLAEALSDQNPTVRRAAMETLLSVADKRAVEFILPQLNHVDSEVRMAAAWALWHIADDRALEPLIKLLRDKEWTVRQAAASTLQAVGDARAQDALIQALEDETSGVRVAAASSLGKIGDQRAVGPLINHLSDSNPDVRAAAAQSLGSIGDTQAIDSLKGLLNDTDPKIRESAAQALDKLGEPLELLIHKTLMGSQEALKELVTKNDRRAISAFIQALNDPDPKVRSTAAYALGELNSPEAVDALIEMAGGWNLRERIFAMMALTKIDQSGSDSALTILKVFASLASIVYLVIVALCIWGIYQISRRGRKSDFQP